VTSDWTEPGQWVSLGGDVQWSGNGFVRKTADLTIVPVTDHPTITRALQIRTPAGTPGGYGPWGYHSRSTSPQVWGSGFREVYLGWWTRLAPDFYGHSSGSNKHAFVRGLGPTGQPHDLWMMPWGSGHDPSFDVRLDQVSGSSVGCGHWTAQPADQIAPGRWYRWEMWYRKPATNGPTGHVKLWRDGVLVYESTAVCDYGADVSTLYAIGFHGTWGGIGGTLPQDNLQWFGPWRVSAR